MKILPSKLFPGCELNTDKDSGFYDIIPQGFEHEVSLFISCETAKSDAAIAKAAAFFDKLHEWNTLCKNAFLAAEEGSEDGDMIAEYFEFYKEEAPEVFGDADPDDLFLPDMLELLALGNMASHGAGEEQIFNVDFTLGFDQLLCAYFNSDFDLDHIAWES